MVQITPICRGYLLLRSTLILGLGLSLVACGDKSEYAGLAPNSYVVEDVSKQENPYSAFVSAYYAEIERDDQLATELYLEALNHSPDDAFISQKAFFQMVMSGRLLEASSIAGSIDEEHYLAGIAKMLSAANALKNGDGDTLLAVSQTIDGLGGSESGKASVGDGSP